MCDLYIDNFIEECIEEVINIRREIHSNPELGMEEHNTSKLIENKLNELNLEVCTGIGNTGVVGLLRGEEEGKTILLRADMDALPLEELTDLPFKSKNKGVMHACGHDAHVAILLGAAKVLSKMKEEIKGNIKFAFQPAEECNPEGGANFMIRDGVLENPKVDAAAALHVWDLPLGKIGIKPGVMMAQSDRIFIKIKGKSSHGSAPHQGVDAIVAAAHVITALQTIVSRNIDPLNSAVVSIGLINGGYRENVIADEVNMKGTVRTFDSETVSIMPEKIETIVNGICKGLNCEYEYKYVKGYPYMYNEEKLTGCAVEGLKTFFGEDVVILDKPATGAEDFAFFSKKVPSALMWVGCKSEKNKDCCILHNPKFLLDERAISKGIKAMCAVVLKFLNN